MASLDSKLQKAYNSYQEALNTINNPPSEISSKQYELNSQQAYADELQDEKMQTAMKCSLIWAAHLSLSMFQQHIKLLLTLRKKTAEMMSFLHCTHQLAEEYDSMKETLTQSENDMNNAENEYRSISDSLTEYTSNIKEAQNNVWSLSIHLKQVFQTVK